ncbi:hypothetical protein N0V93_005098 [Gnomoniopsis smithogilvyi]|uniref:Uncharacterized protein n=1 Tax=Gnomoniopsis smithogilvyi TaxID=1191159 RepID=A0A9W8YS91_9PEZI|nr:hypothetical protein N0V93_005098 [Gnomoniopsis smithogilvyi]
MSSQAPRNGERFHQDFIARIRYSNALPPPPNPPKLIDIPNTGLASGQYTTPGFATRLQREQPLNIEADAELGMPLDLVGMPGVFDGDESSIQAPSKPPQVHPHDRLLLRPLATLGKPQASGTSVSFLRRTEYISNANTTSKVSPFHRQPSRTGASAAPRPPKRKSPEPEAGTPAAIRRKIEKGFEAARTNLKDLSRIKHPTKSVTAKNKGLKVVEAFPILPELGAFPDSGAYVTYKFAHAPMPNSKDGYDRRLETSILKFTELTPDYEKLLKAYERDPANNPKPLQQHAYELYLPKNLEVAEKFRPAFDMNNPNRDEVLGDGAAEYLWARSYVATIEAEHDHADKYSEEIAISLDKDTKAAWYYPIMQRSRMEPPRRILHKAEQREGKVVVAGRDFSIKDPSEEFRKRSENWSKEPRFNVEVVADADEAADDDASQSGRGSPRRDESEEPAANGRRDYSEDGHEESERDAEGDEEE